MSNLFAPIVYNQASSSTLPTNTTKTDYKSEFLQLLLTQLKNQDPSNPADSKEMLAQQAQFASLEQMQNMNTNFVTLMAMQNVSQATNLIGRSVTGTVDGVSKSGQVTGIAFKDGVSTMSVKVSATETVEMSLSNITQVTL